MGVVVDAGVTEVEVAPVRNRVGEGVMVDTVMVDTVVRIVIIVVVNTAEAQARRVQARRAQARLAHLPMSAPKASRVIHSIHQALPPPQAQNQKNVVAPTVAIVNAVNLRNRAVPDQAVAPVPEDLDNPVPAVPAVQAVQAHLSIAELVVVVPSAHLKSSLGKLI